MEYLLQKSSRLDKKYTVVTPSGKKIHFGAKGYSDYTIHKDFQRMLRYNNRHKKNENWTKNGINSAGFWAKWILWNKPSLNESIKETKRKFGINIRAKI